VATLLWRSETENAFLNSRVTALEQPVQSVLTVPLDVMRSFGSDTPDVRIRKPAGPALLILDIEVSAPMAGAPALGLELHKEQGDQILQLSSVPDADGRIQLALRTDQLPDGIVTLRISESASGPADTRFIELLPAGR
ncbi:MAG: hypothetical protein HKO99_11510, partial [Xanthomonadales bacterium]|nr:hypothetical protein [Xanthomonadales bacterium]